MINGNFFLDSHGYPRAEYEAPNEMLGWFLEQDVQSSATDCDDLLEICDQFLEGRKTSWSGTGNAHTVTINANGVRIENEFSDSSEPCQISVDDFKCAVAKWKELLSTVPK